MFLENKTLVYRKGTFWFAKGSQKVSTVQIRPNTAERFQFLNETFWNHLVELLVNQQ
jgi:hypothetical protein